MIGDCVARRANTRRRKKRRVVVIQELELVLTRGPQAAGAPVLHPERPNYFHSAWVGKTPPTLTHPNQQGRFLYTRGESEPAFADAHKVFEHRFSTQRVHAGYIEPHATLVWIADDGTVHIQSPNKSPFALRGSLAHTLDVPANTIVIEPSAIGGDFGGKAMTVDEPPCYFLAKATGRPVRYVTSYTEELNSACQRHPATLTLRTAVDANGKFLSHHSTVVYDGGAYGGGKPVLYVLPGLMGYSSVPYYVPHATVDVTCYYTNGVPGAHVRSPADQQVFFAWEQHVDMMAQALGLDPIELRLRNVIVKGQTTLVAAPWSSRWALKCWSTAASATRARSPPDADAASDHAATPAAENGADAAARARQEDPHHDAAPRQGGASLPWCGALRQDARIPRRNG